MRLIYILFLVFIVMNSAIAQEIIEGEIQNAETGEPLPAAHINISGSHYGTISNNDGEFYLSVESLPVQVMITYMGYHSKEITVQTNDEYLIIELEPLMLSSDELIVEDDYEIRILERAIEQLLSVEDRYIGRGFYRQTSRVDTIYTEFIEAFYGGELSANNVEQWRVEAGRYAVIQPNRVPLPWRNRNFSILSRRPFVQSTSYSGTAIWPIREDARVFYDFYLKDRYFTASDTLLVIQVEPKSSNQKLLYEGAIVLAENGSSIREIELSLPHPDYSVVKLNRRDRVENDTLKIRIEMAEMDDGIFIPRLVEHSFEADYVARKGVWPFRRTDFMSEISTISTLFYFDYTPLDDSLVTSYSFFEGLDADQNDYMLIDQTDYNPAFWRNNPIIRRTPIEESIIESFERYGSFGKMFNEDL